MSSKKFAGNDGDWVCTNGKCTNVNFARRTQCNRCGAEKSRMKTKDGGLVIGKQMAEKSHGLFSADDWQCKMCGNVNWARRNECNVCHAPKFGKIEERTGYGGGFNERGTVEYRPDRGSDDDEEYDEFGRKKKKYRETDKILTKGILPAKVAEEEEDEEDEEDDDDDANLDAYKLDSDDDDDDDDDADLSAYALVDSDSEKKAPGASSSSKENSKTSTAASKSKSLSHSSSSPSSSSRSSRSSGSGHSRSRSRSRDRRTRSRSRSRSRERRRRQRSRSRSRSPSYRRRHSHSSRSKSDSRSRSRSPLGRRGRDSYRY